MNDQSLGRMFPSNGLIEGRQDKGIADSGIHCPAGNLSEKDVDEHS